MFDTLEIFRDGQVATIWMNRPDRHNTFNAQVIAELTQAFELLGADESVRVVVLAGRGKSFSAGADLNWMKAASEASFEDNLADARNLAAMLRRLAEMPKPTIARVQGAALGGGMGLAAACDICVAATAASFATSEVKFGLIPSAIGPYVLRAIGARQASRYFLTAERIDARKAQEIGLAHEVVEEDELHQTVGALAEALLAGGPQAQGAAKALIRDMAGHSIDDSLVEETARRIAVLRGGGEAWEGLSAFLDKRPPRWGLTG
jgi:methylglutaconyl-CoA hydratase